MAQVAKKFFSPEEYLAMEVVTDYKNEYFQGEIFAMAGGSFNHNRIVGNVFKTLSLGLDKKPCHVLMSDMRLLVKRNGLYTYPDVQVVCGKVDFAAGRNDTITNPILIVEVLSPSTRDYDRIRKFALYKQLDSLREYLLVDSEQTHVTLLCLANSQWIIEMYDDINVALHLESIGCDVNLRDLYDDIEFE